MQDRFGVVSQKHQKEKQFTIKMKAKKRVNRTLANSFFF